LDAGKVVIVAGFQGVSKKGEITTLGRGGSDTSAVALGVAFGAKVEFYKDVPGIFSEDPKKCATASHFSMLSYDEALSIVNKGAKVLHPRCIHLASKNALPLQVLSFEDHRSHGTLIQSAQGVERGAPIYEDEAATL
jgi:aspartate kinase